MLYVHYTGVSKLFTFLMDIGKALTYYTKDEKFVSVVAMFSLLLLSCIFILPILFTGPLMVGYTVEIVRRIQNGDYSLPEIAYTDFWKKGIMLVLVQIAVGVLFMFLQLLLTVPLSLIGLAGTSSVRSSDYSYGDGGGSGLLYLGTSMVSQLISLVFGFIQTVVSYAMIAIYARTDNVNSLFNFGNYKKLWANNGANLIILPIVSGIVGGVIGFIGFLAFCIGILPASVVATLIQAGLIGQVDTKEVA